MPRLHTAALASVAFLLCSVVSFAQRDLGTITGTVLDPQGAAVPNAKVTITNEATGVTSETVTTDSGGYSRPALNPGTYDVTVEAPGFEKAQQKGIVVNPGQPVGADITMQVGSSNQIVEVTAEAPLLQTETPQVGAELTSAQVTDLPVGGQREFTFLARLSPGVVVAEPGARDAAGGGFSANGVRSTGENNFLLNGVDNNVNVIDFINQTSFVIGPSVEAIGEMQVITNGASAEYGRAAGGILDVNIKQGSNQLHGSAFEFLQNTDLDANRWENNWNGNPRPKLNQNQFGGTLGGPIIKNKLFMFGDYQGTRIATAGGVIQNLGYGGTYTIPTPQELAGNFSAILGTVPLDVDPTTHQYTIHNASGALIPVYSNEIFDPSSTTCLSGCAAGSLTPLAGATPVYGRNPFPNNTIPSNSPLFDPVAAKLAALWPTPNLANNGTPGHQPQNNYSTQTPGSLNQDQGDGRVDYHLNDNNNIFGSISWSDTVRSAVPPFKGALDGSSFYGVSEVDLGRDAVISWTHTFSPTLVNEARVGFSRLVTARTQGNANTDVYKQLGIGGYDPTTTLNGGAPQFDMGNYSQVGANNWLPTKEYSNEWDFIENLSWVKGQHSWKFGAEFRPFHFPFFQVPEPHGELYIDKTPTGATGALNCPAGLTEQCSTGDEVASLLLGAIDGGQISSTNFISSTKQAYAFYAQDTWKVSPKLTLNLGVRYELFSPIGEQFGRQSNFVLQDMTLYIPKGPNQNAPLPVNFASTFPDVKVSRGQVNSYLIPWDKTDIGPRLGFAYNLQQKTVIRGFYGIFYGGEENQGGYPNRGEAAPFNESPELTRPSGYSGYQPNPAFGGATGGLTTGFPSNVLTSYPVPLQFREVAPDFRNPMVQEWNIAIQRELPGNMALEVGYLGNHQSHQLLQPDFNTCPNDFDPNYTLGCNPLRPSPEVGGISGTATFGFGNYNALESKLEKRMSNGLQFIAAYTYGHALSNSGTTLSGSNGWYVPNPLNWGSAYSNAAWDIRHNFTLGFNYDIPFGRGKQYGSHLNPIVQTVLGNWQINGILTLHTGQPFTVRSGGCTGQNSGCSPDLLSGKDPNAAPSQGRGPNGWFDTTVFATPPPGRNGDLGINTNYGPGARTLDFSIFKDFAFTETWKLQFRGEAFNLANTPQLGFPDNNLGDSNFGKITYTNAGTERHIQFALRLQF